MKHTLLAALLLAPLTSLHAEDALKPNIVFIYTDDKLQPMHQTESVFKHCHDLYLDSAGDIYVGEWNADRRYPWKLSLVR